MAEMLREGVELMLAGMAVVFSLLTLLVFAVRAMSRLALSIEGPIPTGDRAAPPPAPGEGGEIAAAITAAVHAHRKGKR